MKKDINKILLVLFLLLPLGAVVSQVNVTLTIENQNVVGTDFYFDLYLQAPNDPLYLGNADFVLYFNNGNFTSPVLSKEPSVSPGMCSLVPTDASGLNPLFTQDQYFNNTAVTIINSNELTINLNGPTPSDQTTFDGRVARIEGTVSTHRLGRFKVSGISNASGTMDLLWKTSGSGVITKIFTMAPTTPWNGSAVNSITATNPSVGALPVELTSFTANANSGTVELNWATATEVNNYGFEIERASFREDGTTPVRTNSEVERSRNWEVIGFVEGHGNSNSPKEYSFTDLNGVNGKSKYRLKQIDIDGAFEYSDEIEVELIVVTEYKLNQNYPNPFNPETKITFSIPESGNVKLRIYNTLGEEVAELINREMDMGVYEHNWNASHYSSGIYIYVLTVNGRQFVSKMNLLK